MALSKYISTLSGETFFKGTNYEFFARITTKKYENLQNKQQSFKIHQHENLQFHDI